MLMNTKEDEVEEDDDEEEEEEWRTRRIVHKLREGIGRQRQRI